MTALRQECVERRADQQEHHTTRAREGTRQAVKPGVTLVKHYEVHRMTFTGDVSQLNIPNYDHRKQMESPDVN